MKNLSRREFLKTSGLGVAMFGAGAMPSLAAEAKPKVIVIGGGWGGATAAKYIRLTDPSIEVTLLEPGKEFISCPFSNLVLAGVECPSLSPDNRLIAVGGADRIVRVWSVESGQKVASLTSAPAGISVNGAMMRIWYVQLLSPSTFMLESAP